MCSSMDVTRDIMLSEVSQRRKKYHMISHMWNLKYDTNQLFYKTNSQRIDSWLQLGGRGIDWELKVSRCRLSNIE